MIAIDLALAAATGRPMTMIATDLAPASREHLVGLHGWRHRARRARRIG